MSDVSSQPFTRQEVRTFLPVADRMIYIRRDRSRDDRFYGRLMRVFLTFGPHPSVLPSWGSDTNLFIRPTARGDRMYFRWDRPKIQALHRAVEIEVPQDYRPWLPAFLDQPKPVSEWSYWTLFKNVEVELFAETGYSIPMNPRRARHTCAREMLEAGFSAIDVMAAIRVTPHTLETYAMSTPEQRGEKAEKVGWGSWA